MRAFRPAGLGRKMRRVDGGSISGARMMTPAGRAFAALAATVLITASLALALGPAADVGARGGAGAILNTGGGGPNIIAAGILFFAGLFFLGHVFGLVSGL